MFNTFPTLLAFGLLAPFLLRLTLGLILVDFGYKKLFKNRVFFQEILTKTLFKPVTTWVWILGILDMIIGILFIIGLFTQITAIVALILFAVGLYIKKQNPDKIQTSHIVFGLMIIIAISLLLTGAGFFALDIPL